MLIRLTKQIDVYDRWHPLVSVVRYRRELSEGTILTLRDLKTKRMARESGNSVKCIRLFHRGEEIFVLAHGFPGSYKQVLTHK